MYSKEETDFKKVFSVLKTEVFFLLLHLKAILRLNKFKIIALTCPLVSNSTTSWSGRTKSLGHVCFLIPSRGDTHARRSSSCPLCCSSSSSSIPPRSCDNTRGSSFSLETNRGIFQGNVTLMNKFSQYMDL